MDEVTKAYNKLCEYTSSELCKNGEVHITVEVYFEENIITIGNTDYTKENIRDIIKCLREIGYAL